ncbi:MAG TPA: hypothetical protein VK939_11605 [Longimicrobiales bacterium]|nr:hypothetical protein [Longimicrobiales bacterium]
MSERRYREEELRRILELATRPEAAGPRPGTLPDGLTLAEIQSIALEVGVTPDAVARAAAAMDMPAAGAPRTSLGMPVEVGRIIPLPRPLTDREWDRLVAELRTTFRARGRVIAQGGLREWSNGNLHASVEPTGNGYRLRMGTFKGDGPGINAVGAVVLAGGAAIMGATALAGAPEVAGSVVLALCGAGAILSNLVRLPRWARQRDRQMKHIEAQVRSIIAEGAGPDPDT